MGLHTAKYCPQAYSLCSTKKTGRHVEQRRHYSIGKYQNRARNIRNDELDGPFMLPDGLVNYICAPAIIIAASIRPPRESELRRTRYRGYYFEAVI